MYILSGNKKEIINSDFVERFCTAEKPDAALIIASYNDVRPAVTLAKYENATEAKCALVDLFGAISGGQTYFEMPESRMFSGERMAKDARTKRKGGS